MASGKLKDLPGSWHALWLGFVREGQEGAGSLNPKPLTLNPKP